MGKSGKIAIGLGVAGFLVYWFMIRQKPNV